MSLVSRLALCLALIFVLGCEMFEKHHDKSDMKTAVAVIKPSKGAATQPANTNVTGMATFTETSDGVKVVAHLTGLSPGEHGFHIHDKGDMSDPNLMSTGGHFNPTGKHHGGPDSAERHCGDFGNITADASGNATYEATFRDITLGEGTNSIIGRAVIVHAKTDDLKTDPAGNAGGRIAGGVIELKK